MNYIRYSCCFNNFVEELQEKEDSLIATLESVQDCAGQAKDHAMKPAEVIHKWLAEANPLKDEVEDLLKKARTSKSNNCLCHCPNWFWRYHLGKKLANKKVEVEKCNEEGRPYIQPTLPSMPYFSREKYLEFDSRRIAYKQLMEAVQDGDVSMIGLYGMGGCGKTTLALQLMNTTKPHFDKVLFVTVSSTIDVRSIQDKIASSLQFHFPESGERERAQRLCARLIQENKILLILDDVWQMLDFDTIGIPTGTTHKGCKVLIATRLEGVCTSMDCQRKISLSILEDDEAWALFQKQARLSESTSDTTLKHLGRLISEECKGLPVAIAAVADTLKGKSEVEWKVALDRLRNSKPVNIEKGFQDPYKCLQLSYDNLDTEEDKSLLLLCSAYPEDYEISVEELTRCAIGLTRCAIGLGRGEFHSYEEARNEVCATKNKLISSSLLLAGRNSEGEYVKMHDLVRDVVHRIAKEQNKNVNGCYLPRYLWTANFQDELDFSNLEFLRIRTGCEISDMETIGIARSELSEIFDSVKRESYGEEAQVASGSELPSSQSMKEIGKERIQEGPTPKETMMKILPSGIEGIGFGGEGSNLMNKEGGIGAVSRDNIEVPPDTHGSHSLIIAKLGAYKDFVDMNDAQIAVLAEAIAAYPHLWNVCEKFSERFQALMLKTLADMLWFLRNESAFNVTPTREKEFQRLCDEAVQLGFDSSWVDGMKQRVIVKDPKVEHSQARCNDF